MNLNDIIPSFYHAIFPEILDIEFPKEKIATCDTCTLCRSPQSPYKSTKCCWYYPHLSNFMLGVILTDEDEKHALGKERVRSQIKARAGITPYGTIAPVAYSRLRKEAVNKGLMSSSYKLLESLTCPYYDNGNCTVYKYRNSDCVTFYCSSIGGAAGRKFWEKVDKYLTMAETSLVQYAMNQMGWPTVKMKSKAETISDFDLEDEHGKINEENYSTLWGEWAGREEEFYVKCYEIVSEVDAAKFKQITGLNRKILDADIHDRQKDFIKNTLPEKLILNPDVISENEEGGFTRLSLLEDTAKIPSLVVPLIRGFNGKRTTVEVFQLGFDVIYNLEDDVDELYKKGILIKV